MATFIENRDYMLAEEAAGRLGAGGQNWLKWYRAAGSPETQEEFREFTGAEGVAGRDYDEYVSASGEVSNPTTGTTDGGSEWDVFNPVSGKYETVTGDYSPRGDNSQWGMVDGALTLIRTDVDGWEDTGAVKDASGDYDYFWTYGHSEPPSSVYIPGEGELAVGGSRVVPGQEGETIELDNGAGPDYSGGGGTTGGTTGGTGGGTGGGGTGVGGTGGGGGSPMVPWTPDMSGDRPSWNWDFFKPKDPGDGGWGGFDADYGVFERYQPGQDSPWGMPDIEGGNEEFYKQQFNNLLRDEQDYRTRQRAAQLRAYENSQQEPVSIDYDEMWASMGLEPSQAVQAGVDGGGDYIWTPNSILGGDFGFGSMTDQEIFNTLSPNLSNSTQGILSKHFNQNPDAASSNYWSSFTNPQEALGTIGADGGKVSPEFRNALSDVYNNMFSRADVTTPAGGGPTAAPGYALPI